MKIAIAGAGFICSNLPAKLFVLDQKVLGLDNFETGYQNNFIQAVKCSGRTNGESVELLKQFFSFYNDDLA